MPRNPWSPRHPRGIPGRVPFPYAGEICALLAPLCWSVAMLLYRRTTDHLPGASITLFKNVLALVLLSLTMLVLGIRIPRDRSALDWARVMASGLLGLAVADTLLFEALRRIGSARIAIVDTIYAPTLITLSVLFLGDTLTWGFVVGGAAVIAGVAVANWQKPPPGPDTTELAFGTVLGLLAIAGTATGVVLARPVLQASSLVEVTWTRLLAGVVGQVIWMAARRELGVAVTVFRPQPVWRTLWPAAFIGTYLSLLLWLGGFKWANAPVAAVLNQMATVYMLVLARVVLGEGVTGAQWVGGALAASGAGFLVLSRL